MIKIGECTTIFKSFYDIFELCEKYRAEKIDEDVLEQMVLKITNEESCICELSRNYFWSEIKC